MNSSTSVNGGQVSARSARGLVYNQQSLEASTAHSSVLADAASPSLSPSPVDQLARPRRYVVSLVGPDGPVEVNTHAARLSRCSRRVHAWASSLPDASRAIRRSSSKRGVGPRMVMLTLTYATLGTWEPNQIRDFMTALRTLLGERLYAYAWVLEMQKRGAPHYHVLLWVQRGTRVPKPDLWEWHYGMSKVETARSAFYICKYTSQKKQKYYQKEGFPIGARMFAVKIYNTDVNPELYFDYRISTVPSWLKPHLIAAYGEYGNELIYRRLKGGGWCILQTGEVLQSPFTLLSVKEVE
jgi:hypothetical protein